MVAVGLLSVFGKKGGGAGDTDGYMYKIFFILVVLIPVHVLCNYANSLNWQCM